MQTFDAAILAYLISEIDTALGLLTYSASMKEVDPSKVPRFPEVHPKTLLEVEGFFVRNPIGECAKQAAYARFVADRQNTVPGLIAVYQRLKADVVAGCDQVLLLRVPLSAKELIDNERLFGDRVYDAFVDAREDIREGGNCLAMSLNTAAVFHFMRAVEHAMRALANAVGVAPGKLPLDYQEWHTVIQQIEVNAEAVEKWGKSAELINARQFFHRVVADLYSFKDDVRNVTMHTRKSYNESEARGVKDRVEQWFAVVATKVDDQMSGALLVPSRFTP